MGRKKDEKPIPPMGPGSKVVALTPQLRRHISLVDDSKDPRRPRRSFYVSFNTILAKKVPEEIYKNEELQVGCVPGIFIARLLLDACAQRGTRTL